MTHAPVGDFGPLVNNSLNRIGGFVLEQGLSAEDCVAIFEAGMAARCRLVGPFVPPPADASPDLFADQARAA